MSCVETKFYGCLVNNDGGLHDGGVTVYLSFCAVDSGINVIKADVVPIDRVGRVTTCTETGKSEVQLCVYDFDTSEPFAFVLKNEYKNVWYNKKIARVELVRVHVVYKDGHVETLPASELMSTSDPQSHYKVKEKEYKARKQAEREAYENRPASEKAKSGLKNLWESIKKDFKGIKDQF